MGALVQVGSTLAAGLIHCFVVVGAVAAGATLRIWEDSTERNQEDGTRRSQES